MLRVAIVGRVNAGKSTLFNAILNSSVSVVWREPGTTRDIVEAVAHTKKRDYILMDTAGYFFENHPLQEIMEKKSDEAIEKADIVIAVFDAKTGPTQIDYEVKKKVLLSKKPYIFVINKVDNQKMELIAYDLFSNFLDDFIMVSATTKRGIEQLLEKLDEIADKIEKLSEEEKVYKSLGEDGFKTESLTKIQRIKEEERQKKIEMEFERVVQKKEMEEGEKKEKKKEFIRISFVGRPNVGKSSLINAILGYERCIVYDEPGTTRDAVRVPFEYKNYKFVIVDTPGIRRRSRIDKNSVEFKSVGRSLIAMQVSDVSVLVIDSLEGVTHQDKHLASFIERSGTALVIAFNKIDVIRELKPAGGIRKIIQSLEESLKFIRWAYFVPTSALSGEGIDKLLDAVIKSYKAWSKKLKPSELLKIRRRFLELDFMRGQNPKIFQLATQPPTFLIYVNDPTALRRYQIAHFEKIIREMYDFKGSPIHFRVKKHGEKF